jgi:MFS family permease
LARLISITGSFGARTALLFRIYAITHSTMWVTATAIASSTAVVLVGVAGGFVADRFDRRRVMVASDLAGAGCFVVLALVHSPAPMVALAFAAAVAEAPFWPASSAAVPNLVEDRDLAWANGLLLSATVRGAHARAALRRRDARGVRRAHRVPRHAASFVVSAVILAGTRGSFAAELAPHEEPDRRISAGLALVASRFDLRVLATVGALLWVAFGLFIVADVPLAASFHAGPVGYALLTATWGGTAFVGSRFAVPVLARVEEGVALGAGLFVVAITGGSIALLPSYAAIVVVGGLGGIGQGVAAVAWRGMVQHRTPDAVRGRVFAVTDASQETAFALGMLGGGALVGVVGIQPTYLVPGGVMLLATGLAASLIGKREATTVEPVSWER